MAGTLALTKAELSRLMHNRRYFIFTVAFPVILYLLIGRQVNAQAYGIAFGLFANSTTAVILHTGIAVAAMLVFFGRTAQRHPLLPV